MEASLQAGRSNLRGARYTSLKTVSRHAEPSAISAPTHRRSAIASADSPWLCRLLNYPTWVRTKYELSTPVAHRQRRGAKWDGTRRRYVAALFHTGLSSATACQILRRCWLASCRPLLGDPFQRIIESRDHQQREQCRKNKTADNHGRDPALDVTADARCQCSRHHSDRRDRRGHQHRPETLRCADQNCIAERSASLAHPVEVCHHDDTVLHGHAE